ncbi:MAG: Do family serine endopeptidase [Cyclobacteriaceae bacterium]|nr:Do family serine endopeptidase [Cyclobacteriaceae bacterium]
MNTKHFFAGVFFAAILGGLVAIGVYKLTVKEQGVPYQTIEEQQNYRFTTNFLEDTSRFVVPEGLNFVYAAEMTTPGVVHIKSTLKSSAPEGYSGRNPFEDMLRDFFGDVPRDRRGGSRPSRSFGSGVIITPDGYIVTNNHVIENADEMEVTLNDNRTYKAKLIGNDPNTDLALIKIDEKDLQFIRFGDSDVVKVGEWVLAVGNPFDLTSTVTAGIVSAKARNINIIRGREYGIESFIQTDAAVNPGNSGGALVNLKGQLIGINTAIATPTGSYAGYSFAVPVSIVKKVVEDLKEFGVVQRALLGVGIANVNDPRLKEREIKELQGVYVMSVNPESAADKAGIKEGDIITEVNNIRVNTVAELQDQIARYRPGDKVSVNYRRGGKDKKVDIVLKNMMNEVKVVQRNESIAIEGGTFANLTDDEKKKYKLDGGVKLEELGDGKWKNAGIRKGYIITSIDKAPVENVNDLVTILRNKSGGVLIAGIYPDGEEAYYGIGW